MFSGGLTHGAHGGHLDRAVMMMVVVVRLCLKPWCPNSADEMISVVTSDMYADMRCPAFLQASDPDVDFEVVFSGVEGCWRLSRFPGKP